jgi:DNA modification methylase
MIEIKYVKVSKLKEHPDNPRKIDDADFEKLLTSIKENPDFLEVRPLLVNMDNEVFAGNQRLKAARKLGIKEVPVAFMALSKEKEREFMIRDNVANGEWDIEKLLADFNMDELSAWGLDLPEIDVTNILNEVEEDDIPELPEVAKSVEGEIYCLGEHRVLCGDATDPANYELLMGGKKANATITDPPYLMDFTGNVHGDGTKSHNAQFGSILNDKMDDVDKKVFLENMLYCIKSFTDGAFYICWYRLGLHHLFSAMGTNEMDYKALIIWSKGNHTLSGSDYQSKYEPIVYGWIGKHKFYGGRSSFDIWEISRTLKNELHPTMKPVELMARCVNNSTQINGIVLDPFLGSGSTLIACEQTDRVCYGMELDPKYVDVIRKRYAAFKGIENWEEETKCLKSK